jgi:hypothetical protein
MILATALMETANVLKQLFGLSKERATGNI